MKRRKIRKYRHPRRNSGMKFVGIVGIMVAAVICGYLTARFIIAPLLGYDTEVLKLDFPSRVTSLLDKVEKKTDDTNDANGEDSAADTDSADSTDDQNKADDEGTEDGGGYALQFGVFSSEKR